MTEQIIKAIAGTPHIIWFFAGMAMPLGALWFRVWQTDHKRKPLEKPPQSEKLLRPAGYSLAMHLDDITDQCLLLGLKACALCASGGLIIQATSEQYLKFKIAIIAQCGIGIGLACLLAGGICIMKAWKIVEEMRNVKLGMRGEQAVAEVLHEAAVAGYRVFHDLPGGENWNIDHVVVGSKGVFLIETKTRRKKPARGKQPSHVVRVEDQVLRFPTGNDPKAMAQAERNGKWLGNYLARKTGEAVEVETLVVLPGWFVEQTSANPGKVKVMNTTYLAGYLTRQEEKLPAAQVRRIITAVEEKCRDLEF